MNDNRIIKAENAVKAIEKQGYYYVLAEKYYGEDYIGPKYIIATDDPDSKERHPKLAKMTIVSVEKFLKMAEAINESLLNNEREDNDTSVQPQTQAMGAALRDPQRGEMPMRPVRCRSSVQLRRNGCRGQILRKKAKRFILNADPIGKGVRISTRRFAHETDRRHFTYNPSQNNRRKTLWTISIQRKSKALSRSLYLR